MSGNRCAGISRVRIRVSTEEPERFLRLCRMRGMELYELRVSERTLYLVIKAVDFHLLLSVRRKTRAHIRIDQKLGAYFFIKRFPYKKTLLVGILGLMLLIRTAYSHIWQIHITGNSSLSEEQIVQFLSEKGIRVGKRKTKEESQQISLWMREAYPEISWISVSITWDGLSIRLKEGITEHREKMEESPCDLIADTEGEIAEIITRSGTPLKKTGDHCKKGEVLVKGAYVIMNDSQEIVRTEYVCADADVYIRYTLPYSRTIPLKFTQKEETGRKRVSLYLKVGSWYLESFPVPYGKGERTEETSNVTSVVKKGFPAVFPIVTTGIRTESFLTERETEISKEAGKRMARQELESFQKKLIEKGVQISANNVTIKVDDFNCISKGTITVEKKAERKAPIMIQDSLERNTQNGEQHY